MIPQARPTGRRESMAPWRLLALVILLAAARPDATSAEPEATGTPGAPAHPQAAGRPQEAESDWRQWGGPQRNFRVASPGLANRWPEGGPRRIWSRSLGEGHSAIVIDQGRLYTMYRPRGPELPEGEWAREEIVVALDAANGRTLWEHSYPTEILNFRRGAGPHSTPLVVGDLVFAAGTNKQVHALKKTTGEVVWFHHLVTEYGAPPTLIRPAVKAGYAPSPLAYRDLLIVTAGGEGQAVMAFRQSDGTLVWKSQDFLISPSSPILIDLSGQDQLIVFGGRTINGLDPTNGELLWSHPHETRGDMNNSTPVWGADHLLFVSSAYDGGSRAIELNRVEDKTTAKELWFSHTFKVMMGSTVRLGDYIYGSSGDFGPTFITAVHVKTGETVWQERGFSRASLVAADGKLIILDEDGQLALAKASPEGLEVISQVDLFHTTSWTVPTLVGTTLYLRDRETIMALDIGG